MRGTGGGGGGGEGHSDKRSSDREVANPLVKNQVRDLVLVVGIATPFAPRGSIFRENSFLSPRGKWTQETCAGCPQQRYATGEPGKVQGRDRVGIIEEMWVLLSPLPHGGVIRGKFVLSCPRG